MRKLILISAFLFILVSISFVYAEEIGCPGKQYATVGVDSILNPPTRCVAVVISPGCPPNSPLELTISNEDCKDILIYISGDGEKHELVSKENPESSWQVADGLPFSWADSKIPQEIGAKWTREFYFKNNPDEKIVIDAKNLSREKYLELSNKRYESLGEYCRNKTGGLLNNKDYHDCMTSRRLLEFETEEVTGEEPEEVIIDENITAEDLGVTEPKILPNSPWYFAKSFWRGVRAAFTFNKVKKAELRLRFANEMLVEAKKLAEETGKEEILQKTLGKYQKEIEKLEVQVEKFKEKAKDNPKIDAFLDRFTEKAIKQQALIERLEEKLSHNPEAIEKIKEAKERVLENHSRVIERLEEKDKVQERLEKAIQTIKEKELSPALKRRIEQTREKIQGRIQKIKGACEDLCGDGICQEIVCLATGCPCAETPETCSQDCK